MSDIFISNGAATRKRKIMIGISSHGTVEPSDQRYVTPMPDLPSHLPTADKKPVVWNAGVVTCAAHCYSQSRNEDYSEAHPRRWHPAD